MSTCLVTRIFSAISRKCIDSTLDNMIKQWKVKIHLFIFCLLFIIYFIKNIHVLLMDHKKSIFPSSDLCNVSQWLFVLDKHLGKLQALFWVDPHHIPQQKDPVWSVAHLVPKQNRRKPTLQPSYKFVETHIFIKPKNI